MLSLVEIGPVIIENPIIVFSLFCYYLPLEKDKSFHLNKHESPLSKDALCQVWLKLAMWFLRKFLKFVNVFSLFHNHLPLEKGMSLYLNKLGHVSLFEQT